MENKFKLPLYWKIKKFFGADVIALQDNDGDVTITVAKVNAFDVLTARRWKYADGIVVLNDDGTTSGLAHVKKWKQL